MQALQLENSNRDLDLQLKSANRMLDAVRTEVYSSSTLHVQTSLAHLSPASKKVSAMEASQLSLQAALGNANQTIHDLQQEVLEPLRLPAAPFNASPASANASD
jgi:hypothetical protein